MRRCRFIGASLNRNAVVRGNHLPSAVNVHPDVSEPVMVFVGLPFYCPFLVIRPSYHNCVPMTVNFQVRHFGDFYSRRATTCMRNISSLAVCTTVLNGDDEFVG